MKKQILIFALIALSLLLGCTSSVQPPSGPSAGPSEVEIEKMDYCKTDDDCVCGGIDRHTSKCFLGNVNYYEKYVDKSKDCPDFCSGIAGNLAVRCVDSKCMQVYECLADRDCAEGEGCVGNKCLSAGEAECTSDGDCRRDGCSGELCRPKSVEPVVTVCEYKPEYSCLNMISCRCVAGKCAWKTTAGYDECVQNAIGASDPVI